MNARLHQAPTALVCRETRRVRAGGHDWHLDTWLGDVERPACLILHGTGASADSVADLADRLATDFDVFAPDLPAHARTRSPRSASLDIDAQADALEALVSAIGRRPRLLIGHSAGAVILAAWLLRFDASEPPATLVAINGAMLPLDGPAGFLFEPLARLSHRVGWLPRMFALRASREPNAVRRLLESTGSTVDEAMVARYRPLFADREHVAGVLGMMASWQLARFAPRLSGLRSPVHLIAGDRDRTIPLRQSQQLERLLPDATLDVLPGLGHLLHEEAPSRVADTILARLAADGQPSGTDRP